MQYRIAILDFTTGAVRIFNVFIPENMDPDEWVAEAYGSNVQYMLDPAEINIRL